MLTPDDRKRRALALLDAGDRADPDTAGAKSTGSPMTVSQVATGPVRRAMRCVGSMLTWSPAPWAAVRRRSSCAVVAP